MFGRVYRWYSSYKILDVGRSIFFVNEPCTLEFEILALVDGGGNVNGSVLPNNSSSIILFLFTVR